MWSCVAVLASMPHPHHRDEHMTRSGQSSTSDSDWLTNRYEIQAGPVRGLPGVFC